MPKIDQASSARHRFDSDQDRNVFVVMRYGPGRVFAAIEETIRRTVTRYGLTAVLATDHQFHPQLWDHIRFCMTRSRYAIVVFERIVQPDFNPNVALELGYMLSRNLRCLILRDVAMPSLPTDVIGHLYTSFDSHRAEVTVGAAVSKWLERLGHSSVRPAETIAADSMLEANIARTQRIVEVLRPLAADRRAGPTCIIRQEAALSSLAISTRERHGGVSGKKYLALLTEERTLLTTILEAGGIVRLIICPHTQVESVRIKVIAAKYVRSNVLPRFRQLALTLREHLDRPNLQVAFVVRTRHDNLLIVGESSVFTGRKRVWQKGFPHTTIVHDPALVHAEIDEFDTTFRDAAGAILRQQPIDIRSFGSKRLKAKVLERLKESERGIQQLLRARLGK